MVVSSFVSVGRSLAGQNTSASNRSSTVGEAKSLMSRAKARRGAGVALQNGMSV